jgi:hypothetical protein
MPRTQTLLLSLLLMCNLGHSTSLLCASVSSCATKRVDHAQELEIFRGIYGASSLGIRGRMGIISERLPPRALCGQDVGLYLHSLSSLHSQLLTSFSNEDAGVQRGKITSLWFWLVT